MNRYKLLQDKMKQIGISTREYEVKYGEAIYVHDEYIGEFKDINDLSLQELTKLLNAKGITIYE